MPAIYPGSRRDAGLNIPCATARAILQAAAIKLRQLGADTKCLSDVALADALEDAAGGDTEAACQALADAEAYRRMVRS